MSTISSVHAQTETGPEIQYFNVLFLVNGNPELFQFIYQIEVTVFNPLDTNFDGDITGVYVDGERLVDVVISVPDGTELRSATNEGYAFGTRENAGMEVFYMRWDVIIEETLPASAEIGLTPYGWYEAGLYSIDSDELIDTVSLKTPYMDESGDPAPVPIKSPIPLSLSQGENTLETTPTFEWIVWRKAPEPSAFINWYTVVDIIDVSDWPDLAISYWFVGFGGSNPGIMSVTFPDAPEVPPEMVTKIAAEGTEFPSHLPIGWIAWQMTSTEFFPPSAIGGESRCSFYTAHSNIIWVNVNAEAEIVPNTLNLASNGKWIQACIELPDGYSAQDVDLSSIRINNQVPVDLAAPAQIGDSNSNGKQDFIVRFDRAAVMDILGSLPDFGVETGKSYDASLTITGNVEDTWFSDVCTVRVLRK